MTGCFGELECLQQCQLDCWEDTVCLAECNNNCNPTTTEDTTTVTTTTTSTTTTTTTSTTAGPDWEEICAQPEESLESNLNFNAGKWGTSKIMFNSADSVIIRTNINGRPAATPYTGSYFFARKYCGADFLNKLADGTVTFDIQDNVESAENIFGFYKDDAGNTAYVIQYSNTAAETNAGNAKRDTIYLTVSGLSSVNWGNKSYDSCLAGNLIAAHMDYTTEDKSPCLAWQRTVGN